ncbi:hypothetical protein Q5P01_020395 [Channa striata]|uniref:Uncharacterized protein n=1 Tax=Channa striata TaxID=64152 RepID=A0AA88SBA4_CHASR|nr:hypothetical protein Q5P01_020395 [Channa striata]
MLEKLQLPVEGTECSFSSNVCYRERGEPDQLGFCGEPHREMMIAVSPLLWGLSGTLLNYNTGCMSVSGMNSHQRSKTASERARNGINNRTKQDFLLRVSRDLCAFEGIL